MCPHRGNFVKREKYVQVPTLHMLQVNRLVFFSNHKIAIFCYLKFDDF